MKRNNEWQPRRFNRRPPSRFAYERVGQSTYEVRLDGVLLGLVWNGGRYGWSYRGTLRGNHDDEYESRESAARALEFGERPVEA